MPRNPNAVGRLDESAGCRPRPSSAISSETSRVPTIRSTWTPRRRHALIDVGQRLLQRAIRGDRDRRIKLGRFERLDVDCESEHRISPRRSRRRRPASAAGDQALVQHRRRRRRCSRRVVPIRRCRAVSGSHPRRRGSRWRRRHGARSSRGRAAARSARRRCRRGSRGAISSRSASIAVSRCASSARNARCDSRSSIATRACSRRACAAVIALSSEGTRRASRSLTR